METSFYIYLMELWTRHAQFNGGSAPLVDRIPLMQYHVCAVRNFDLQRERGMTADFAILGQRMGNHINIKDDPLAGQGVERQAAVKVQRCGGCREVATQIGHAALRRTDPYAIARGIKPTAHECRIVTPPLVGETADFNREFFVGFHLRTNIAFLPILFTATEIN